MNMANNKHKTGEKAPEGGTYKVESLVNGGDASKDDTSIKLEKGEQFPPSTETGEAAYWTKTS